MDSSIAGNKQLHFNLKAIGSVNQLQKTRIESSLELKLHAQKSIMPRSNDMFDNAYDLDSFDSGT